LLTPPDSNNDRGPLPDPDYLPNQDDSLRRQIFLEGRTQSIVTDQDNDKHTTLLLGDQSVDPEQLAYILIGVCVGLSILCLIVVAVTIGYKSETHYRFEGASKPQRGKRIRLIKASSSEGGSTSNSETETEASTNAGDHNPSKNEDLAQMKLGSWFTSKHPVQTLDRKKAKMVYPSAVYLDNLEGHSSTPVVKESNRAEVVTDEENFEDDLNHQRTTSRAKITKKMQIQDANSEFHSSLETIKSEGQIVEVARPRNSSESTAASSETTALTKPKKYHKNTSIVQAKNQSRIPSSSGSHLKSSSGPHHDLSSQVSSREGSFRFLQHEVMEGHNSMRPQQPKNQQPQQQPPSIEDDTSSIQWSTNSDRLI